MRACLLAIGDELLDGRTVDTNSPFLAGRLMDLGIDVARTMIVGDGQGDLLDGLQYAIRQADAVIIGGGLGPTEDDRTREVVAELAGKELYEPEGVWEGIQAYFSDRGLEVPDSNRRQALIPQGAEILANPVGTAPGFALTLEDGTQLFCLPGVPTEARTMFDEQVAERLRNKGRPLVQKSLAFAGVSESHLGDLINHLAVDGQSVRLGLTAGWGIIRVTMRAFADSTGEAEAEVARVSEDVRQLGARFYLGEGRGELQDFLAEHLIETDTSIALAESCTAGLVASRLGSVPGISGVFSESYVTYSNDAKERLLGVPARILEDHGAVSAECALAMAEGLAKRSGARLVASVSGIAGPSGGTPEKPVGLVHFAAIFDGKPRSLVRQYGAPSRALIRNRAANDLLVLCLKASGRF